MSTSTTEQLDEAKSGGADISGKYLTFALGGESFGIAILKVREIIGLTNITAVPQTPSFVKGIINLRGSVIPVIDLNLKFGMAEKEYDSETCIIVADIDQPGGAVIHIGAIVDAVDEVLDISPGDIEPAPSLGASVDTRFIRGIGKSNDRVTILLDIDSVLSDSERATLSSIG